MKTRFTFISVLAVLFTAALAPVDAAKAVSIIKGPYLQQVTQDSIVIMWETDVASDSRVDYGLSVPSGIFVTDDTLVNIHEIELTGLNPGSIYGYTVTSGGTTSPASTFVTVPATEQSFRFVAYGNTRSNAIEHRKVILAIIDSAPDLVIHTGDLVYNGNDYVQWNEQFFPTCYDLMINTPLLPILGNHEYSSGQTLFFDFFSLPDNYSLLGNEEQWFAFTYGGVRFIGLNTNIYSGAGVDYSLGSEQYNWLVSELDSSDYNDAAWHIVYFHHPPYTCSSSHSDDTNVQKHLVPLFEQYGVDMVFNGHSHVYERYSHNGIYYIVTGGGGAPLSTLLVDNKEPIRQVGETTFHHCVIDVTSTSLILEARYNDGQQFDTITITRTEMASNPNPADLAENVPVDTVLSWRAGIGAVSHNVYFGTAASPPFIQNQDGTSYDPEILTPLSPGITYYWKVDEFNSSGGITPGDVWSFTTEATLPWSDDFESGSFAAGGWTTSGNTSVSSKADYLSTYGAEIKGTSWIEKAVSTVGFSNINIKYARKTKGLDNGEYLYVEWFDGSGWHELEATQDTSWSPQNLPCGAGANGNAAFKVRFGTNGSNSAEYAYVDDVEIYESTVVTPPEQAANPSPENGAADVAVDVDLSWTAGAGAQSHDVYFGTDLVSLPLKSEGQSTTTYDPGILANDTTYLWRIDENNANGTTTGIVWNFTTQSAGTTVYVSDITMDIIPEKKYYATATVKISPTLEGATVVGDWYFKGVLRQAGATGDITAGEAFITSMTTPAKSGDTFTFVVTDVIASGYIYNSPEPPDGGSIAVE